MNNVTFSDDTLIQEQAIISTKKFKISQTQDKLNRKMFLKIVMNILILIITLQDKDWKDKPYLNDFNSMTNSAFSVTTKGDDGSPTKSFSIDNSSRTPMSSFSKIKSGRKISSEYVNNNYYRLQYWVLRLD